MINTKKNHKILYILEKAVVLSIICSTCSSKNENVFKEEESFKVLKILVLINNVEQYQKLSKKKYKSKNKKK